MFSAPGRLVDTVSGMRPKPRTGRGPLQSWPKSISRTMPLGGASAHRCIPSRFVAGGISLGKVIDDVMKERQAVWVSSGASSADVHGAPLPLPVSSPGGGIAYAPQAPVRGQDRGGGRQPTSCGAAPSSAGTSTRARAPRLLVVPRPSIGAAACLVVQRESSHFPTPAG